MDTRLREKPPVARVGQDVEITQPGNHSLANPCIFSREGKSGSVTHNCVDVIYGGPVVPQCHFGEERDKW